MAKPIAGLGRRAQFLIAGVACICGIVAVGILALGGTTSFPSLGETLFVQPVPVTQRLYSGATDPTTGAPVVPYDRGTEVLGAGGVPTVRYLTYKDGSLEVIDLASDGVRPRESRLYYPHDENPDYMRLHKRSVIAANGKDIVDQTIYRISGTRQQQTTGSVEERTVAMGITFHTLVKTEKTITDFAEDGTTLIGNQYWSKEELDYEPVLRKEQRWLANRDHSLIYNQVFEEKLRKTTKFDTAGQVTWYSEVPETRHAVVTAYFPGSRGVRLQGKADWYNNTVDFLRTDGTRDHTFEIGPSQIEVEHFDASGKKKLWKQTWWHNETGYTSGKPESLTNLSYIFEYDDEGEDKRVLYFAQGKLKEDRRLNYTVGGIKYFWVESTIDENGYVTKIQYYLNKRSDPPVKVIEHKPEEKVRPDFIRSEHLAKPALEEGLIIPIPQTSVH